MSSCKKVGLEKDQKLDRDGVLVDRAEELFRPWGAKQSTEDLEFNDDTSFHACSPLKSPITIARHMRCDGCKQALTTNRKFRPWCAKPNEGFDEADGLATRTGTRGGWVKCRPGKEALPEVSEQTQVRVGDLLKTLQPRGIVGGQRPEPAEL